MSLEIPVDERHLCDSVETPPWRCLIGRCNRWVKTGELLVHVANDLYRW